MKLPLLAALVCIVSSSCAAPAPTTAPRPSEARIVPDPATPEELRQAMAARLANPRFNAAAIGIKVVSMKTGETLFETNAHKLLKPASNAKLYTAALALEKLGPEFRIRTSLYARTNATSDGVVQGDLIVYGRGDPSFAARFGVSSNALAPLACALKVAGIQRIEGDLVGDETYFTGPPLGSGWAWDDLAYYYGAEVSALTLEDNVVDLYLLPGAKVGEPCSIRLHPETSFLTFSNRTRTVFGSKGDIDVHRPIGENVVYLTGQLPIGHPGQTNAVTMHNPARFFVHQLREELKRHDIEVTGALRTVNWLNRQDQPIPLTNLVELAGVDSPPLKELLPRMVKPSQNLYAQLLPAGRRATQSHAGRASHHGRRRPG